jgi:hypothetical protein
MLTVDAPNCAEKDESVPTANVTLAPSSESPDDSRQTLWEMQQACSALIQREVENTMLMLEDAERVRFPVPPCTSSEKLPAACTVNSMYHFRHI